MKIVVDKEKKKFKTHLSQAQDWIQFTGAKAKKLLKVYSQLSYSNDTPTSSRPAKKSKGSQIFKDSPEFFQMLAQKENPNPTLNFAYFDGAGLPEEEVKQINKLEDLIPDSEGFNKSYKPLALDASNAAVQIAHSPGGGKYYPFMTLKNRKIAVHRKESPQETKKTCEDLSSLSSPHKLRFLSKDSDGVEKYLPLVNDKTCKVKHFSFTVTRDKIRKRKFAKRPCTQKKLVGGVSAFEFFKKNGVHISEKLTKLGTKMGKEFQIPHIWGFSEGGPHNKSNVLRGATAGSNIDTLFKIERLIKKLLFMGYKGHPRVDKVMVDVEIRYAKDKEDLPFQSIYTLTYGANHQLAIPIDYLSDRRPTIKEMKAAEFCAELESLAEFPSASL